MKFKRIISTFLFAALTFTTFSCIEDKGNYTYKDTNIVKFEGLVGLDEDKPYEIFLGEPMTIKPEMTQTVPTAEEDYTYIWLRVGTRLPALDRIHFDTIHVGKYMEDFYVPLTPRSAAYKMVYQAINNITGVTYTSDYFYFKVVGDITTGYLVLHEVDDLPVLKFHNYKGNRFDERGIDLSSLGENVGKPINIVTYPDSNSPAINATDGYSVSLLTESGLYRLKYDDFSYEDTYNIDYFMFGDKPAEFQIQQIYPAYYKNANRAIIKDQNGDLMYYLGGTSPLPWTYGIISNAYLVNGVKTRFTPGAFLLENDYAIIYDATNRNVVFKTSSTAYCQKYPAATELMFQYNDVDYTPLCFMYQYYVPAMPNSGYRFYMVVKMDSGGYKLRAWSTRNNSGQQLVDSDFNVTDIANAKYFSTTYATALADYNAYGMLIYYATDKKVYCYNMTDKSSTEVYKAPDGNVINSMKIEVKTSTTCPFGDHMLVTTNSETGAETSTFEIFKITPLTGELTIAKDIDGSELRWTGMPKIVGVDWKNK